MSLTRPSGRLKQLEDKQKADIDLKSKIRKEITIMKRLTTKIITIASCAVMMLSVPFVNTQSVQAAVKSQGTVNLATTTKKLSIPKGTSTAIKNNTLTMVKGRRYAVKFKIKGKTYNLATLPTTVGKAKINTTAIASIKNNLLTANKAGTTTFRIIKGSKNLVSLKVKVIDTAAHKHAWKNITKATCATKGKKLCKTCGATGTTAILKTHTFIVTKKATCASKGTETCTGCGLTNTLPKTKHNYVTDTWESVEGRGKKYTESAVLCNGCNINMTDWTQEQIQAHQYDLDGILAGTSSFACMGAGTHGAIGKTKYEKYAMVKNEETTCKNCGAWNMDKTKKTDLYEVYYDEWGNTVRKDDNTIVIESPSYTEYKKTQESLKPQETAKKAAAKRPAVADPQDVLTEVPDTDTVIENGTAIADTDVIISENSTVSENEAVSGNAVSENTISENEAVTDNSNAELNTEITDQETGGDSLFGDSDDSGIVIENTDNNDGIVIEDIDETDTDDGEEDNGTDDYDDSEGIVIEDE